MGSETTVGATNAQAATSAVEAPPVPSRRRRRLWWSVVGVVALAGALGFLFRAVLLQSVAGLMIVEEPLRRVQCALLLERTCPLDEVARLYRDGLVAEVALLRIPPRRIERLRILPPQDEALQRELASRGIPRERMELLDVQPGAGGDHLRRLQPWLESRPELEATAFVRRFDSRTWQYRLRTVLPPALWARIHLRTFSYRAYDETNWWRHRTGVVSLFNGYLGYGYVVCRGEDVDPEPEWDPDAYLQALRGN
jgi:hypothetical protein